MFSLRIKEETLLLAIEDLSREHPFAFERVGYFHGKREGGLVVLDNWLSFKDDEYLDNTMAGACIGPLGMQRLSKEAFNTKDSYFHFHLHGFQEIPEFSGIDMRSLKEVSPGLFGFSKSGPHGGIVKGRKGWCVALWSERKKDPIFLEEGSVNLEVYRG
ncbi:MAG: hypothetical protein CME70_03085 [Halobacteriovorax sp.]|nr:hypothetical protein [Halobacteriovorax sp.]